MSWICFALPLSWLPFLILPSFYVHCWKWGMEKEEKQTIIWPGSLVIFQCNAWGIIEGHNLTVKSQLYGWGRWVIKNCYVSECPHLFYPSCACTFFWCLLANTIISRHLLISCTKAIKNHFLVLPGLYLVIIFVDLWMCLTKNSGVFSHIPSFMLVKFHAIVRLPYKPESWRLCY